MINRQHPFMSNSFAMIFTSFIITVEKIFKLLYK